MLTSQQAGEKLNKAQRKQKKEKKRVYNSSYKISIISVIKPNKDLEERKIASQSLQRK